MSHAALYEENSQRILIVDDAQPTQRMLALQLERAGYAVVTAARGEAALALIRRHGLPRLALLDMGLPGMDGIAVAQAIRQLGAVPLIFLTAPTEAPALSEEVQALAAARLVKPVVFAELLETVRRVLEAVEGPPLPAGETMLGAGLYVNFSHQYLLLDGHKVPLTPTETRLLQLLYAHRGRVVSPGYLVSQAWRADQRGTLGSLWVHIRRLRSKLERTPAQPHVLLTVRGQGYSLHAERASHAVN